MIFYLCNGSVLSGTQADARALDKNFVQLDIPVDKAGLMAFVNDLYTHRGVNNDHQSDRPLDHQPPGPLSRAVVGFEHVNSPLLAETSPLTEKIDSWFAPIPETQPTRPIDRLIATATYTEALRINQASVERMIVALLEQRASNEKRTQLVDGSPEEFS